MRIGFYKFLFAFSFICMLGAIGSMELNTIPLWKGFITAVFWICIFTFSLYKMDNK